MENWNGSDSLMALKKKMHPHKKEKNGEKEQQQKGNASFSDP